MVTLPFFVALRVPSANLNTPILAHSLLHLAINGDIPEWGRTEGKRSGTPLHSTQYISKAQL